MIDRMALVRRHNPRGSWDPYGPLTVGNGEFAFTADPTGTQTFAEFYESGQPLVTQSQWGWHTTPAQRAGGRWDPSELRLEAYDVPGRSPVGYATDSRDQEEAFLWLRENPHRLHLGRIALDFGAPADRRRVNEGDQLLDLWTGVLTSRFTYEGDPVVVQTLCHPDKDLLSFSLASSRLARGNLALTLEFPYGSPHRSAADWSSPGAHDSRLTDLGGGHWLIDRTLDADGYRVVVGVGGGAWLRQTGDHCFSVHTTSERLEAGVWFLPSGAGAGSFSGWEGDLRACRTHWEGFWNRGGAVELVESTDPRAPELERRIVLSQYLLAVQCAGSLPPQETGLSGNSWYGKFHLEMHWWHGAWLPLWGRPELLERSLGWYRRVLPGARARAASQGWQGARWPKMVGPEGDDSPSAIGPLLIWQQPHLIHLAELIRRARPGVEPDGAWDELIADTADFMVSFATAGGVHLGPPVIPAQENHAPRTTTDPALELAYWSWGLSQADAWFRRRGRTPHPLWAATAAALPPLFQAQGVYQAHAGCPDTFENFAVDHPSMLGALGMLPGVGVDRRVMAATLERVWTHWNWDEVWGWDFPLVAMTAARLGQPEKAVDALLHPSPKNTYSPNGHNRQGTVAELPVYLPGNGGLLVAIALMAAGWDGAPEGIAPGFPSEGWVVRYEGLVRIP